MAASTVFIAIVIYEITSQCPVLSEPTRLIRLSFLRAVKSRLIVFSETEKTRANSSAVEFGLLRKCFMISSFRFTGTFTGTFASFCVTIWRSRFLRGIFIYSKPWAIII